VSDDEKANRVARNAIIGVVVIVAAVWGVDQLRSSSQDVPTPMPPSQVEVCWSGTARMVDITVNVDGTTEQASKRDNDQCVAKTVRSAVVLSAQNSTDTGTVECEIRTSGGTVLDSASSTGGYVIAMCSTRV
jgi:hypothetical protein